MQLCHELVKTTELKLLLPCAAQGAFHTKSRGLYGIDCEISQQLLLTRVTNFEVRVLKMQWNELIQYIASV